MGGYRTHEKEASEPATPHGVEHNKAEEQSEIGDMLFSVGFGFAVSSAAVPMAPAALAAVSHPNSVKQRAAMLRSMQKRQGNAYVQNAVAQQKRSGSAVTNPQDRMEQEADRNADSVMHMPEDKITAQPPKQDTPKQDTPKQDTPKQDTPKQDAPKKQTPSGQAKSGTQAKTDSKPEEKKEAKKTDPAQSKAQQDKSAAAGQPPAARTAAAKTAAAKTTGTKPAPGKASSKAAAPKSAPAGQASGRRKAQAGQRGASKSATADAGAVAAGTPTDAQQWSRKFATAIDERIGSKTPDKPKGDGTVNEHQKSQDAERKTNKTDYKSEAQANIPAEPKVEQKPPVEIAPVMKDAQALIEEAANNRLSDQIMSSLQPTPGHPMINNGKGRMPALDAAAALAESAERRATEAAEAAPADKDRAGKDKPREKKAGADDKQMSAGAPELITLRDEGPTPDIVIPQEQKAEMDKSIGAALTLLMSSSAEQTAEIVKDAESAAYNGNLLNKLAPELAKAHLDEVKQEVEQELSGIADAAGLEGEALKKKAQEQKSKAKDAAGAESKESKSATDNAGQQIQKTGIEQQQAAGAASAAAKAEIERKAQDANQPPEPATIEEKKNRMLQKVLKDAAAARAAFRMTGQKRESELTKAGARQSSAYSLAANQEAAEIKAFYKNDDKEARIQSRPSLIWGDQRVRDVEDEVIQKKRSAAKQVTEFQSLVDKKELAAREKIITWAHEQLGTQQLIAQEVANTVEYWKEKARADIEAWQKEINRRSKEALIADFALLVKLRDAREQQDRAELEKIISGISEEQQGLVGLFFSSGENALAAVAATLLMRIKARRVPALVEKLREESTTKIQDLTILERLGQSQNRDFSARALAIQIRKAITSTFVGKEEIFSALSGRTPVQMAAIKMAYSQVSGRGDMSADLKSALTGRDAVNKAVTIAGPGATPIDSVVTTPLKEGVGDVLLGDAEKDDDWRRAEAAMKGDKVGEDVFALHGAITGYVSDADKTSVMSILRNKTPAEREELFARYEKEHGKTLKEHLKKEFEGLDKERAFALLAGDVEKADALAIHQAVKDKEDINAVDAVYEQIRKEVEAEAAGGTWTTAEVEAEVKRRAGKLEAKYNKRFAKDSTTDLHGLIVGSDLSHWERNLALAHMSGDRTAIDAAKMWIISDTKHPSDQKINALLRAQLKRAETDVRRDVGVKKMELQVEANMRRMELLDKISKEKRNPAVLKKQLEEMDADYKARIEKMDKETEQNITDKAKGYLKDLEKNYDSKDLRKGWSTYNDGSGAFTALIQLSMSGNAKMIAEQIRTQGKLTEAQEIFYAVYDVGTDNSTLRQILKNKTPAEINEIEKQYEATFKNRNFYEDVMGEADSPREEYEFAKLLEGVPQTMEGKKRRLDKDRAFDLDHPELGVLFAVEESNALHGSRTSADEAYDKYKKLLDEKGPDNEETKKAQERFNILAGYTEMDQDRVREAVEDITDKASMVAAIAAGLLVAALTAGTASPAVIAAWSAMASTGASIYTKAVMKGSSYGGADLAQDIGIGMVDTAAAVLTAGIGSALLKTRLLSALASKGVIARIAMTGLTEGIENVINGLPSGILSTALSEEVWQDDALNVILKNAISQSAMGFGMGFGMGSITAFKEHKMQVKAEAEARSGKSSSRPHADAAAHADGVSAHDTAAHDTAAHDAGAHAQAKADAEAHPGGRTGMDEPSAGKAGADASEHASEQAARRADVESRVREEPDLDAEIVTHTVGDVPETKLKEWSELESLQDDVDINRLKEGLLSGSLKDRVPILRDPDLPGNTVLVHYDVVNGLVTNVRMRVGPRATAYDVYLHRQTAKLMYRYSGFSGKIFRLISRMEKWVSLHGQPPVGSLAWEAKLEIDKLPRIIEARMDELSRGALTKEMQERIKDEIGYLREQLARHRRTLAEIDLSPGEGFVAAKGLADIPNISKDPVVRSSENLATATRTIAENSPLEKRYNRVVYQIGNTWQYKGRVYRLVEVLGKNGKVLRVREEIQKLSKSGRRVQRWVQRGSEANVSGRVGESASKIMTEAEPENVLKLHDFDKSPLPNKFLLSVEHQDAAGRGFDGVVIYFENGQAKILIVEVKNYKKSARLEDFSAITGEIFDDNWQRLEKMLRRRKTFKNPNLVSTTIPNDEQLKDIMSMIDKALKQKDVEIEVRVGQKNVVGDVKATGATILKDIQNDVSTRLGRKIPISKEVLDPNALAEARKVIKQQDRLGRRNRFLDLLQSEGNSAPTKEQVNRANTALVAENKSLLKGPARPSSKVEGRYFDAENNPFTVVGPPGRPPNMAKLKQAIIEQSNQTISLSKSGQKKMGVLLDASSLSKEELDKLISQISKLPNADALRDRLIFVDRKTGGANFLVQKGASPAK